MDVIATTNQRDPRWNEFLAHAATFKPWKRGARHTPRALRDRTFARVVPGPVLGRADLRNNGLLSPPKQQGNSDACTSFAIAAAAEAAVRKQLHPSVTLAPWFIHTCLMHRAPGLGVYIEDAMPRVIASGIAYTDDSDRPFPDTECNTTNCLPIAGANPIPDAPAAKAALDSQFVVVSTILVNRQDFVNLPGNAVYSYQPDIDAVTHTICIVGYDDPASYWIIQNSQGAGWSDQGFGRIAYGACGMLEPSGPGDSAVVLV